MTFKYGVFWDEKCRANILLFFFLPVSVVGAWSVLCAGHHNNRVRACDAHGCGAFNSNRDNNLHKAVDLVCDDYGIVNAPFSGSLAGPVSRKEPAGNRYEGVKLLNDGE
ncbi:leukocyte cell-derived chemotaxin-2-like [Centropristis striata]|uniref:leukocyte cell-derived chemotaxin-2-like n=1 Tax=Centropristis striata TaxID=184440 RepID=UPI0027E0FDF8|nr:leukocyte cell-derived chemotaxin-2-like [Centropristis striata]